MLRQQPVETKLITLWMDSLDITVMGKLGVNERIEQTYSRKKPKSKIRIGSP